MALSPDDPLLPYLAALEHAIVQLRARIRYEEPVSLEEIHDLMDAVHNVPGLLRRESEWFTAENIEKDFSCDDERWTGEPALFRTKLLTVVRGAASDQNGSPGNPSLDSVKPSTSSRRQRVWTTLDPHSSGFERSPMRAALLSLGVVLLSSLAMAPILADDGGLPLPFPPGSYVTTELDGTHPYAAQGLEVGIDVEFLYFDGCVAVYETTGWRRPLGGGAKIFAPKKGEILWDACSDEWIGEIISASTGRHGDVIPSTSSDQFTIDFAAAGGNTRLITKE